MSKYDLRGAHNPQIVEHVAGNFTSNITTTTTTTTTTTIINNNNNNKSDPSGTHNSNHVASSETHQISQEEKENNKPAKRKNKLKPLPPVIDVNNGIYKKTKFNNFKLIFNEKILVCNTGIEKIDYEKTTLFRCNVGKCDARVWVIYYHPGTTQDGDKAQIVKTIDHSVSCTAENFQ